MNPGDTTPASEGQVAYRCAQRRPGHEPRRHTSERTLLEAIATALNEGRGMNPGDTDGYTVRGRLSWTAQRRPGHEPRRHLLYRLAREPNRLRSTKAGA